MSIRGAGAGESFPCLGAFVRSDLMACAVSWLGPLPGTSLRSLVRSFLLLGIVECNTIGGSVCADKLDLEVVLENNFFSEA
jgi:hypothetical protein